MSSGTTIYSEQGSTLTSQSKIKDQTDFSALANQDSSNEESRNTNKFCKRDFAGMDKRRSNLNLLSKGAGSLGFEAGINLGANLFKRENGNRNEEAPKITEYSVFWISSCGHVTETKVSIEKAAMVEALMKKALTALNEKALREDFDFQLLENPNLYEIYFAKKNGLPKLDLPAVNPKQQIFMFSEKNYVLKELSKDAVIQLQRRSSQSEASHKRGNSNLMTKITTQESLLSDSRRSSTKSHHYENILVTTKRNQANLKPTGDGGAPSQKKSFWSFFKICSYEKSKD